MGVYTFAIGILLTLLTHSTLIAAQTRSTYISSQPLYDNPAEGSESWIYERQVIESGEQRTIYNTIEPVYEVHLPSSDNATGAAVVMLPGGAMRWLTVSPDTSAQIETLLAQGIAVVLLEYRTLQMTPEEIERRSTPPPADAPPTVFPKMEIRNGNANPSPDDPALNEVLRLATEDAHAALRLVHENAQQWKINPDRIGVIGTSAGGGVGFSALMADAPEEEKPDFLVSIFGPSLVDIQAPADDAAPLFLVTEANHGPVTDGLLAIFSIWKDAGQPVELHVYEVPNFSMTVELWGPRLFDWMREQGILPTVR